jgi:hypothetical protein
VHAGHGGVDCEVAALGDAAEDALEGVLEDAAVVGLALLEGMFGEFALGDVDAGALVAENVAGLVTEDVGVEQDQKVWPSLWRSRVSKLSTRSCWASNCRRRFRSAVSA